MHQARLGGSGIKGEIVGIGLDADEVIATPAELVFYPICGFAGRPFRQGVFNLNLSAGSLALDEEKAVYLLARNGFFIDCESYRFGWGPAGYAHK